MKHGRLRLLLMGIAVLMLSTTFTFGSVHAAEPPIAKIVSVDYPRHALAGAAFPVNVAAEYSDKVGVDVGIWEVQTGVVVQSLSIPLQETGRTSFTFKLTAPATTGDWNLLVITRIWWQDAWYQDPLEGSQPITISVSNTVNVVLASSGAASTITFDGSQYALNSSSSLTVHVNPGVHNLEAQSLIRGGTGERFVFVGWSDGINSDPRQIVISGDVNIAALYRTEYYLSVGSERGLVSGQGWYPAGSTPSFAVVPTSNAVSWFGLVTENYRFAGWSGDSSSGDTLASVTMSEPKSMLANWASSGMTVDLMFFAYVFLLGSLVLTVRGVYRYPRRRALGTPSHIARRWVRLIVPTLLLVIVLIPLSPTYAQLPIQSGRSIVKIGDASWYYWNNTASDTCLLWLGGGTTDERDIGYYFYEINPFQYESFGTIRFMQDLAKYYCVVALEQGSYGAYSPNSNRTIYQEPYQMGSRIIGDVHDWIRKQGYAHTFLVGYSTGAQVAAMEVAVRAPEDWTGPDGLVLITPRLSEYVIGNAYRIHASLLILYGGSIETPAYVSTGHDFYVNAPRDGLYGSDFLHKEFHVIDKTGHEVWTIYETGAYDTHAVHLIVNFIDEVKSLQFTPNDTALVAQVVENSSSVTIGPDLNITSVHVPYQASAESIMRVEVTFTYNVPTSTLTQIIAYNTQREGIESAAQINLTGSGDRVVTLDLLPSSNSSELSLAIIALIAGNEGWQPAAKPLFTTTKVLQAFAVTVVSTVPSMPFTFDGSQFRSADNGVLRLETSPGTHVMQVESVTYLNPLTRVVFVGWDDGSTEITRQVTIDNDTSLVANYRIQYFVNATSAYGRLEGSGWHDANSTAVISVDQPLVNESMIFAQWAGDASSNEARSLLSVNSQKTVRAEWISVSEPSNDLGSSVWFVLSLILFAVTLIWNLRRSRPIEDANHMLRNSRSEL